MEKVCTVCKLVKPLGSFGVKRGRLGGQARCRSCVKVAQQNYRLANGDSIRRSERRSKRRNRSDIQKRTRELAHRAATRLLMTGSRVKLEAEIRKCDLVCACCHRLRTSARASKSVTRPSRERFYERIDALKGAPCLDCGQSYPARAMDFDHVSGTKFSSIAQLRAKPWDVVALELSKCELVCANCHRVRTWNRKLREVA